MMRYVVVYDDPTLTNTDDPKTVERFIKLIDHPLVFRAGHINSKQTGASQVICMMKVLISSMKK